MREPDEPTPGQTEELPTEIDPIDPLKRNPDEEDDTMPGLDPVVSPYPPE